MGFSNIDCINVNKLGCEYYIDRFFCPENCKGYISKGEKTNEVKETIEYIKKK